VVKIRDDLQVDYSVLANVKERIEVLIKERFKGKYDMLFHADVLRKISDQFEFNEKVLFELRLKVQVLVLYMGTMFAKAKTDKYMARKDWLETHKRMSELLQVIRKPVFVKSLKEAYTVQTSKSSSMADDQDENEFESRQNFDIERQVFSSLSNYMEGLHDQLWRAYQSLVPTNIEYL